MDSCPNGRISLNFETQPASSISTTFPTRYPNGLPGGIPSEAFTSKQATEAMSFARQFIARARG